MILVQQRDEVCRHRDVHYALLLRSFDPALAQIILLPQQWVASEKGVELLDAILAGEDEGSNSGGYPDEELAVLGRPDEDFQLWRLPQLDRRKTLPNRVEIK
jgi:hypothetical protein